MRLFTTQILTKSHMSDAISDIKFDTECLWQLQPFGAMLIISGM